MSFNRGREALNPPHAARSLVLGLDYVGDYESLGEPGDRRLGLLEGFRFVMDGRPRASADAQEEERHRDCVQPRAATSFEQRDGSSAAMLPRACSLRRAVRSPPGGSASPPGRGQLTPRYTTSADVTQEAGVRMAAMQMTDA